MSQPVAEYGKSVNITATGDVILTKNTVLLGFYVNSTTAGTLVLRRGGSGGTVLGGTITPAIGFHKFPVSCIAGLHATVGGTIDVTFFVLDEQP